MLVAVGGGESSPFLLNVLLRVGLALGYLTWSLSVYGRLVMTRDFWRTLGGELWRTVRFVRGYERWRLFLLAAAVGGYDSVCFGMAMRYVDVSVVAVATELWPIGYTLLRHRLMMEVLAAGGVEIGPGWKGLMLALLVGAVGVALVVGAQGTADGGIFGESLGRLVVGLLLCLLASVLGAMPACSLLWGSKFSERVGLSRPGNGLRRGMVCVPMTMMVCNVVTLPPGIALGLALGESWPANAELGLLLCGVIVLGGMLCNSFSAVVQVVANLLTRNSGVNVLGYLGPAASVTLLYVFWEVGVEHWLLFWFAVALVVGANLVAVGALSYRTFSRCSDAGRTVYGHLVAWLSRSGL